MEKLINYILVSVFAIFSMTAQTCDVNIFDSGVLQTHNESQMGIFGNLNNDGSFSESGGEVGFYNQNQMQTISGLNTPQFFDLIVDVPNDLNIDVATDINLGLQFNSGRIITPRNEPNKSVNLVATDLYFDENEDRHVDGYTSYSGTNAYTFPIGDAFRYRPLSIEASGATNTARAAYFFEDPNTPSTFSGFDREETEDGLESINAVEFLDLDGNTPTRVTLTWDTVSNIGALINDNDLTELRVVGWSIAEDRWVDLGNASVSGNVTQGQIISDTFTPNNYEVITFGGPRTIIEIPDDIEVLNAVSADGNNENPYFRIKGINAYPNNNLKIFNRWGVIVFEMDGYTEPRPELGDELDENKVFMGKSNGRVTVNAPKKLPTGTYFYILNYELNGFGEKSKAGYLYLQN